MNDNNSTNYSVVLADTNSISRQECRKIIKDINGLKVLGQAGDILELLQLVKEKRPNLIITETHLGDFNIFEGISQIKQIDPSVRILILTEDSIYLQMAFSVGVDGYLLNENKDIQLVKAIETIRRGNIYLSTSLYNQLKNPREKILIGLPSNFQGHLTKREKEILKLLAEGRSSKQIAEILYISIYTVRRHRDRIMQKLELRGLADLVRYAIEHGYIEFQVATPEVKPVIIGSIKFSQEHYQAGLTILSYFGKIVRQKYAGEKIKVSIEQEELTVRMIIQTNQGNIEKIEKTLEEYGLVIKGDKPIAEFLSDPYEIAELRNQLRIATVQLEYQKDLLALTKNMQEQRIYNLEDEVNRLHSYIGSALKLLDNKDNIVESSIKLIANKLLKDINQDDFLEIKDALEKIRKRDQTKFSYVIEKINKLFVEKAISGAAGHALYEFIKQYIFS